MFANHECRQRCQLGHWPSYSITSSAATSSVGHLGGLAVDDQLDLGGLLHRQVSRLRAL
jgi:hypothetical protein